MSRTAIIGFNSSEYVANLLNIWNNGDCVVLLDPQTPSQTAVDMMKEADVHRCYIEKSVKIDKGLLSANGIEFVEYEKASASADLLPESIYDKYQPNYTSDEAVVIYSSGTTGRSKGIILSHYAINTNADSIIDYLKPTVDDCIYIAKPLQHSSTLVGELLVALKTKTRLVIAPTIVPPRFVFSNIERFGVTILCLNPMLMKMYAEEYARKQYNIPTLKTIYISGSILNDAVYESAHNTFKNVEIYNVYGLTEAGPRVAAQRFECSKSNSVGKPINGVEIAIVDELGNALPQNSRGIIHVKTKSKYLSYISGVEKHKSLYEDWLNTGDIGFIDDNAELHIVGRIDDVINIGAHKIYPSDIERCIMSVSDVSECVVTSINYRNEDILCCFYVAANDVGIAIKKKLVNILTSYEIPKLFVRTDEIPKSKNGKVLLLKVKDIISEYLKVFN